MMMLVWAGMETAHSALYEHYAIYTLNLFRTGPMIQHHLLLLESSVDNQTGEVSTKKAPFETAYEPSLEIQVL